MSSAPKKPKIEHVKRRGGPHQKKFMQVGQRGFLVTCNFREKECLKESYNLLNSYKSAHLETKCSEQDPPERTQPASDDDQEEQEEEDIATQLANEIKASKAEAKKSVFQAVDTQTTNCIFIDARIPDPLSLGVQIVRDVAESRVAKTRFLLRLLPVEVVCKANLVDILAAAEKLFDKHFLHEPKTFSIMFNRRYNNDIKREEVIRELAEIINAKNMKNKVDLKNAQVSVLVEVIKGFCCLSVLPDYLQLKKYNLVELAASSQPQTTTNADVVPAEVQPVKAEPIAAEEK